MGDMAEYHFTLHHLEGKKNAGADALSRRPDHDDGSQNNKDVAILPEHLFRQVEGRPSSNVETPTTILEEIETDIEKDRSWQGLKKFEGEWTTENNGIKRWRGRIYVPGKGTRERILREHHDSATAGHPGRHRMHENVFRNFWWPTLRKDINTYVRGCQTCQKTRPHNRPPPTTLRPSEIPNRPWQRISVDLIGPLPRSKDFDAIMVVIDYFTKMGHFIPTNTTLTAEGAARLYIDHCYERSIFISFLFFLLTRFTAECELTMFYRSLGSS
jgi:hypothetical protein